MTALMDLTGRTFGHLTVTHRGASDTRGKARWWCRCACGEATLVIADNLRRGNTRSCGHLQPGRRPVRAPSTPAPAIGLCTACRGRLHGPRCAGGSCPCRCRAVLGLTAFLDATAPWWDERYKGVA